MNLSDGLRAFAERYRYHVEPYEVLNARYRPEFIEADFARACAIADGRERHYSVSEDFACEGTAFETDADGGSSWDCPRSPYGHSSPNHWCGCCHEPAPGSDHGAFRALAREATRLWVESWERRHGSRFLSEEEVLARLMADVWLRRNIRRRMRRSFKGGVA